MKGVQEIIIIMTQDTLLCIAAKNVATMLGQSKSVWQTEIESVRGLSRVLCKLLNQHKVE